MNTRQMDTRRAGANGERGTARRLPATGAFPEHATTARAPRPRWQTVPLAILVAALAVLIAVVVSDGHPYAYLSALFIVPLAIGIALRSWYWPLVCSVTPVILVAILILPDLAPLVFDWSNADPEFVLLAMVIAVDGALAAALAAASALIGTFIGRRRFRDQ